MLRVGNQVGAHRGSFTGRGVAVRLGTRMERAVQTGVGRAGSCNWRAAAAHECDQIRRIPGKEGVAYWGGKGAVHLREATQSSVHMPQEAGSSLSETWRGLSNFSRQFTRGRAPRSARRLPPPAGHRCWRCCSGGLPPRARQRIPCDVLPLQAWRVPHRRYIRCPGISRYLARCRPMLRLSRPRSIHWRGCWRRWGRHRCWCSCCGCRAHARCRCCSCRGCAAQLVAGPPAG